MCSLNIRKTIYIFTIAAISMQLFGCGGGGGGSTAPTSLVYSGNTNIAVITLDNATTLVGNVLYGGEAGTSFPVAATLTDQTTARSSGAVVQSEILQNISQHIHDSIFKNNSSLMNIAVGVDLNEPLECDNGSGSLIGSLNDLTFTGTLTITYTNCLFDDTIYNGTGTFRIDAFDLNYIEITDATVAFTLLTISSSEFTGSMSGTIRIQSMIISNTEKVTLNYVSKDSLTGKLYKFENMVITIVYDQFFTPTSMTETITGNPARTYDSVHGYVDVNTTTPLVYSSVLLANPDSEGVVIFTGTAGSSIRVTVLSSEHIQLELDIDGAPGYEVLRILLWDDLKINSNTNIIDSDSDGMHDNWETLYGLDHTIDDSADDLDNDGFSNYQEYLDRTDPTVHEIVTLEVPLIDLYLSGFSTDGYRGQTFTPNEDITAESLTVHIGRTNSTAIDFRILIVEVVETPEFHPTNVLYESSTISIPQSFETPPQSVTVDLENLTLNAGQTYAWILDGFVAYDGTNKSSSTAINNQNSYTEGYMIDFPPNPLYLGTREEHFADTWMVDMNTDMPFTLEYRPIIGGAL